MAQYAMSKVVIADQSADFVVVLDQFWHVTAKCGTAFSRLRSWPPTRSEIPAHGFISTGSEAGFPCIARFILAGRHEMFEHSNIVRKKWIDWNRAGDLYRRRPIRAKDRSGSFTTGSSRQRVRPYRLSPDRERFFRCRQFRDGPYPRLRQL